MQTFVVVAIVTGVVVAAGGLFAADDPLGWFAQRCQGDAIEAVPAAASSFQLRLTLQDNETAAGSDTRTCMFSADGTKLFDQTYHVAGETGWMWDVHLPGPPATWVVEFGSEPPLDLSLGAYLEAEDCEHVAPEMLATHQRLIMMDCVLPSRYIPMERAYAPAEQSLQSQSVVPWTIGEGLRGGGAAAAASVAAGTVGLVAGWRFRRPIHWFAAGLFTRIVKPRVLEHPVRNELVQLVQTEPGIHRAEIARRLELAAGQTIHHLRVLVAQNVLSEVPNGWSKHYVAWGRYSPQHARRLVILRSPACARVLALARAHPGASLQRLAMLSKQSTSFASKTVKRLEAAGLLRIERAGKWMRVYANDAAVA
jgi:hypothetical protein